MKMRTLISILTVLLAGVSTYASSETTIYGHRGGVYIEGSPANAIERLEAAIERGYQAGEIDIRQTADREPVGFHDNGLSKYFRGECQRRRLFICEPKVPTNICELQAKRKNTRACTISSLTWNELESFRSKKGYRISHLEEHLRLSRENDMDFMLDIKSSFGAQGIDRVAELMKKYGYQDAVMIGNTGVRKKLAKRGIGLIGLRSHQIFDYWESETRREGIPKERFFLFQHGNIFSADLVRRAQEKGIRMIPSINWFHYGLGSGRSDNDPRKVRAIRDVKRLYKLGVRQFQIDSQFDEWLLQQSLL